MLFKNGPFPASFSSCSSFQYSWLNAGFIKFAHDWIEPRTSGVWSDLPINWATTTSFKYFNCFGIPKMSLEVVCLIFRMGLYGVSVAQNISLLLSVTLRSAPFKNIFQAFGSGSNTHCSLCAVRLMLQTFRGCSRPLSSTYLRQWQDLYPVTGTPM